MAGNTARLLLVKPDYPDPADIEVINANMDILDSAIGATLCSTSLSDISDPYSGQIAYVEPSGLLFMFYLGKWHPIIIALDPLLVDDHEGNYLFPTFDGHAATIQLGEAGGVDDFLLMGQDAGEIFLQGFAGDGAFEKLKINEAGGDLDIGTGADPSTNPTVTIGPPGGRIILSPKGVNCPQMNQPQKADSDDYPVTNGWDKDHPHECEVSFDVPPSGKVLIEFAAKLNCNNTGVGYASYDLNKNSGGGAANPVGPGAERNTIKWDENETGMSSLFDLVSGLTPGANYTATVMTKKDSATVQAKYRKILAVPQV